MNKHPLWASHDKKLSLQAKAVINTLCSGGYFTPMTPEGVEDNTFAPTFENALEYLSECCSEDRDELFDALREAVSAGYLDLEVIETI